VIYGVSLNLCSAACTAFARDIFSPSSESDAQCSERIYGFDWRDLKSNWNVKVELKAAEFPLANRCQVFWLNSHLIANSTHTTWQEGLLCKHCLSACPSPRTAKAGWLWVMFYGTDVAQACLICSSLCFRQQKSLFSIPAGTNVTVLVPSEEAIKSLNSSEKDFWLTPYMLPFLVRYEESPAFAFLCLTTVRKLYVLCKELWRDKHRNMVKCTAGK